MAEQKELRIDLDYYASTYGMELLQSASFELKDDGGTTLVLVGQARGKR